MKTIDRFREESEKYTMEIIAVEIPNQITVIIKTEDDIETSIYDVILENDITGYILTYNIANIGQIVGIPPNVIHHKDEEGDYIIISIGTPEIGFRTAAKITKVKTVSPEEMAERIKKIKTEQSKSSKNNQNAHLN